ncbi:hypothetical protein IB267_10025 [Ensifer sp. ENS09]|uniref:hypothetical protein n=1 Tax=Ensifer sp. ENS09 TaxID=2769263 RepID=UPI00177B515A|nr:hypothetical protein [Ensifer sp. ENS09]MBD9648689.1 hypothetical protein [Ensifer sp. ENS09]
MQIYGLFSNAGVTRPATSGAAPGTVGEGKSPASTALLLGRNDESAANRAAIAKKKLDDVKEQLRMLRFFASDPETLARLAKQLAQQLGTAAQQLAGAGGGGAGVSSAAAAATTAATALADAGSAQADTSGAQADATADSEAEPSSGPASFAERAYREFGGYNDSSDVVAKVAAELKSVAEQVKQLLRKAEQELRAQGSGRDADEARTAGQALSAATGNIEGAGGGTTVSLSIPTSISV